MGAIPESRMRSIITAWTVPCRRWSRTRFVSPRVFDVSIKTRGATKMISTDSEQIAESGRADR